MKQNVYEITTQKILDLLATNDTPWTKPWVTRSLGQQKNLSSLRPYTGLNALLLALNNFDTDYWLTFKQADELGLKIQKGQKSSIVIGWFKNQKREVPEIDADELDENADRGGLRARFFRVFNLSQFENVPQSLKDKTKRKTLDVDFRHDVIPSAEKLFNAQKASVHFGSEAAFYRVREDQISMPDKNRFPKIEEFYSTLFHELGHWTGHETRLNRHELVKGTMFASKTYSQEELVAEMCSVFVCSSLGITTESSVRNSAAYCQSWLKFLKSNPKAFVVACQQGQKAADFILSKGIEA